MNLWTVCTQKAQNSAVFSICKLFLSLSFFCFPSTKPKIQKSECQISSITHFFLFLYSIGENVCTFGSVSVRVCVWEDFWMLRESRCYRTQWLLSLPPPRGSWWLSWLLQAWRSALFGWLSRATPDHRLACETTTLKETVKEQVLVSLTQTTSLHPRPSSPPDAPWEWER